MGEVEIRPIRFGAPAAQTLVAAAEAELAARYGGSGDDNPIEAVEFDPPEGCFLVAWRAGSAVACGGWRTITLPVPLAPYRGPAASGPVLTAQDDLSSLVGVVAEIKRMYVVPAARGTGMATAVLRALEQAAVAGGVSHLVLETGDKQPEAIQLYASRGYDRIVDYGYYRGHEGVISYGRRLP